MGDTTLSTHPSTLNLSSRHWETVCVKVICAVKPFEQSLLSFFWEIMFLNLHKKSEFKDGETNIQLNGAITQKDGQTASFRKTRSIFPKVLSTHTHWSSIPCGLTTVQTYGVELYTIWPTYITAMHPGNYSECLPDVWCRSAQGFSPRITVQERRWAWGPLIFLQ